MSGWEQWIKEKWRDANKPLLGICLGMQLLATHGSEGSNDDNYVEGLDLIPGKVDKLVISDDQVLPHVGWNSWIGETKMKELVKVCLTMETCTLYTATDLKRKIKITA